ncbi:unnamed protein product [Cyprideis torosa]|uniref:Potassium channel tetramerisation-type BTB domain-containing protein n=1 Tax=Cyprideis torosa TaxID=163714 RepID=A0A7R8WLY0_9CRUS|nr:unnamed protein product [Cyprideis torosa]CAG0904818.1 unnamed protein product [Cyprideis torosa]
MLYRMFQEDSTMVPSQRDASGSYLIDRSPKYFEPILNYIRTGNLVLDDTVGPEGVLQEAIFFGVDSVIPQLEALVERRRLASVPDPPLTRPQVISALIRTASNAELRFQGVNLTGADLSKLDLRFINLKLFLISPCVNFFLLKYSCLRDANFQGTSLNHANLERVDLRGANLEGAHLLGVRLMCANLEGATLKGCYFEDPLGTKACLEGANLKNAVLENSAMAGVNLRVANLKNANLRNCDLRSAVLAGADLENCDLTGSDLHEANLRGANLNGAALELMVNPIHMAQTTGATTGAVIRYAPTNSAHTM